LRRSCLLHYCYGIFGLMTGREGRNRKEGEDCNRLIPDSYSGGSGLLCSVWSSPSSDDRISGTQLVFHHHMHPIPIIINPINTINIAVTCDMN